MLQSMTGYGQATKTTGNRTIFVEIKSLNSKTADFKLRLPLEYREKENELRKLLLDQTERGKLDFLLDVKSEQGDEQLAINVSLYKRYLIELRKIHEDLGYEDHQLAQAIVRIPNVMSSDGFTVDEDEWKIVLEVIDEAITAFKAFRSREGESIRVDMEMRCGLLLAYLLELEPYERERTERMKQRIFQMLNTHIPEEAIDRNRFEQEVLYYLEKMDITEEKTRLKEHLSYFLEVLNKNSEETKGRKLSFISQELGREINTIGSKANDSDLQRIVVQMKDELEKIKEQLSNIL
jgi:uncharacterized protein (TIGR00255 family)